MKKAAISMPMAIIIGIMIIIIAFIVMMVINGSANDEGLRILEILGLG